MRAITIEKVQFFVEIQKGSALQTSLVTDMLYAAASR